MKMSTPPQKAVVPQGIPEAYRKALEENRELVEELFVFGVGGKGAELTADENSRSSDSIQNLLHFLDVFIEVFNYSAKKTPVFTEEGNVVPVIKGDSPVIHEGVRKFRELFRQGFRGVQYLPVVKFKEVSEKALKQAMFSFRAESLEQIEDFKKLMDLERGWLEKINEQRRRGDLEVIKAEAIEDFKAKVLEEFPLLYVEEDTAGNADVVKDMKYYEDAIFQSKLDRLVVEAKKNFKELIPFHDQEDLLVVINLCSEFERVLEEAVIKDMRIRNSARVTVVQAYMDKIVETCVDNYSNKMASVLEECSMDKRKILEDHEKLSVEWLPTFVCTESGARIEIGSPEYQSVCYYRYNTKILEKLEDLMKVWNENLQLDLETCENESSEEVRKCLEKVTGILEGYGLEQYATGFRSHVETGLGLIFADAREKIVRNNTLLSDLNLERHGEDISAAVHKFKIIYAKELIRSVRESLEYPNSVDKTVLERSHSIAVKNVESVYQTEFPIPSLEHRKLTKEIGNFMETLVSRALEDIKAFLLLVREYHESGVKFRLKYGMDVMPKGVQVQTRFNSLSMIPEYENRSLEELRWAERERQQKTLESIILFAESKRPWELTSAFQKNLTFTKTPTGSLTPFPDATEQPLSFSTSQPLASLSSNSSQLTISGNTSPVSTSSGARKVMKGVRRWK